MNVRQALILVAVFVLGVLTAGAIPGRPASADPPRPPEAGRYQIVAIPRPNNDAVVVFDTATGQCWNNAVSGGKDDWSDMGTPTKGK